MLTAGDGGWVFAESGVGVGAAVRLRNGKGPGAGTGVVSRANKLVPSCAGPAEGIAGEAKRAFNRGGGGEKGVTLAVTGAGGAGCFSAFFSGGVAGSEEHPVRPKARISAEEIRGKRAEQFMPLSS